MFEKIKKTIFNNYKWFICFICLILFLALAEDVFNHEIMNGDIIGYKFVSTYIIRNSLTPIIKIITWFGSATCLLSLTLLLFITIKNKKTSLLIGINLVTITILNQLLDEVIDEKLENKRKLLIQRAKEIYNEMEV